MLSGNGGLGPPAWTPLGPAPILFGQTPGSQPVSGRVAAIAADPTDPATIYVATAGGGVWKTTDAGADWTPLTDDQPTLFMGAIALAPSDPNTIYAGTGEATNSGLSFTGHGVLKSTDAGATWTLLGADVFDRHTIAQIVVAPDDPNTVYVAVGGSGVHGLSGNTGVWRSTNGGATWTNTTTAISRTAAFSDVEIDPTNPQTLYAAAGSFRGSADNGVYKSTDGGDTWSLAGNFPRDSTNGRITVAVAPANPQILYAVVAGSGQGGSSLGRVVKMLESTDGGDTWTNVPVLPDVGGNGWYGLPLAVDPANPDTIYVSGGGSLILESNDAGFSWFDLEIGADRRGPHADHHAFAFDANGILLDGNDGGVWRLDNPTRGNVQWTDLNNNLQLTQYIGIALDPTDPNIAYGGSQDNGTSKFTGSQAWSLIRFGDGGFVRVDLANPRTVYHEYVNIDLERSDDGGRTWAQKSTGINHGDPHDTYIPYVMDPANSQRLVLGTNRVYETTNRGDSWQAISQPGQGGWTTTGTVDSLAVAASDSNTIYASAGGHLFVTFDDGAGWQQIDIPGVNDHFQDIQIDPTNNLTAYAVRDRFGGGKVFRTTDGGQTWADISGNLPDLPAYTLALDSLSGTLYVGMDDGVYASTDQGNSWARFGSGLPNVQVRELEFRPELQILAAGTHGRGMWEIGIQDPAPPPAVANGRSNPGAGQRSLDGSALAGFPDVVTVDPAVFGVTRLDRVAYPVPVSAPALGGPSVADFAFRGAGVSAGSLTDSPAMATTVAHPVHAAGEEGSAVDPTGGLFRLFGEGDEHLRG
jgi:photosystem II stability/assembly factor-like uncharacterized protein